ncbi:hypothetical protein BCR33DRAFT_713090 [Rhizoclosmatium globosum]|uniref:Uncharacterized protein n=1 Tax=Rhizoclosmatium globosum TaxID=329046 RepID=A0A1Y2CTE5_9FUNG|nr:hypothetical protein BCR33DRAFT_713090 [Rhizoclosmatium globosum]|eukprot:ORY50262.1 hypothetical protein BCR33DRAFT_713090 [Rhizoclosmatium globosum]
MSETPAHVHHHHHTHQHHHHHHYYFNNHNDSQRPIIDTPSYEPLSTSPKDASSFNILPTQETIEHFNRIAEDSLFTPPQTHSHFHSHSHSLNYSNDIECHDSGYTPSPHIIASPPPSSVVHPTPTKSQSTAHPPMLEYESVSSTPVGRSPALTATVSDVGSPLGGQEYFATPVSNCRKRRRRALSPGFDDAREWNVDDGGGVLGDRDDHDQGFVNDIGGVEKNLCESMNEYVDDEETMAGLPGRTAQDELEDHGLEGKQEERILDDDVFDYYGMDLSEQDHLNRVVDSLPTTPVLEPENTQIELDADDMNDALAKLQAENEALKAQLAFPSILMGDKNPMAMLRGEAVEAVVALNGAIKSIRSGLEKGFAEVVEGMAALKKVEERLLSLGTMLEV